jgi:GLPGLI family protein
MKNILLVLTISFLNVVLAQNKNVSVKYSVKIYDEEIMKNIDQEFRKMFVEAMTTANLLTFNLIISESGSKFYEESILSTTDEDSFMKSSTLFSGYNGITFQYFNNLYFDKKTLGSGIMVKEPLKSNWVLHDETMLIDNYLCYKATNIDRVDNGAKKIFNHPVVAWYCPELPYSYGPNGYSNLPGLILQLQVRNVVFAVKKIDLNSDSDFDASFLKTVKTISLEELNKKIIDEMQLLKNSIRD